MGVKTPELNDLVEYATNTGGITAAATSDTTNFLTGGPGSLAEEGAAIGSINSSTASNSYTGFDVQFSDDIRLEDKIELEVWRGAGPWVKVPVFEIVSWSNSNAYLYGMCISQSPIETRKLRVCFGNGGRSQGSTYGSAGINGWASVSTYRWRVKRTRTRR